MKQVLVIAKYHQSEALRVAAGLTLLNDSIKVDVIGKLEDSPDVNEQKEVLDFAEVPCEIMDNDAQLVRIAQDLMAADVAFLL
ncbi:MAG: hypothetical protein ACYDHY_13870 [Acidiferrobacterales bacterium]